MLKSSKVSSILSRIYGLLLLVFIILCLYFGKSLFIPFAIAILFTFILSPLINILEQYIGRIFSILIAFFMLVFVVGILAFVISKQLGEFAIEFPKYKANIENKLYSFDIGKDNPITVILDTINQLENHLPGKKISSPTIENNPNAFSRPITVVKSSSDNITGILQKIFVSLLNILGSTGLFFLLLLFMLFSREDLRGRLIKLIGPTHVSATTLAMNDAGQRITYYLITQLCVNFIFGTIVAIGLYFIGIPNAFLWGGLAMLLRFIPYIGSWISAIFPFIIALAISPDWTMPILTLLLFIFLDLITGNIIEPLLFASNTGISSLALIVSAVFWTLLWGPIGLLLSTPLTVCIIVMGIHIPKLAFLNVLLSDEKGISLYEEFYQRLIDLDFSEATSLITHYLKNNSQIELYDSTILPALSAAEIDRRNDLIEEKQMTLFYQNIQMILDDMFMQNVKEGNTIEAPLKNYKILCLAASTERDEIASTMLMGVLIAASFKASTFQKANVNELIEFIEKEHFDAICISIVAPYLIIPAKKLARNLHQKFPDVKLIIGLWGALEISPEVEESLKHNGIDYIVFSLAQAVAQFDKLNEIQEQHSK